MIIMMIMEKNTRKKWKTTPDMMIMVAMAVTTTTAMPDMADITNILKILGNARGFLVCRYSYLLNIDNLHDWYLLSVFLYIRLRLDP